MPTHNNIFPFSVMAVEIILFGMFWVQWFFEPALCFQWALTRWNSNQLFLHWILHTDGIHLFWNMACLWIYGCLFVSKHSNIKLILLLIISTLIGGISHAHFDGDMAVGISAGLRGIIGYLIMTNFRSRFDSPDQIQTIPHFILSVPLIAFDVIRLFTSESMTSSAGHLGGAATGAMIGAIALAHARFRK